MKKYFFMALLASLLLMPSCKKESKSDPTEPVLDNTLIQMFNYNKVLIGTDSAATVSKLISDGYELKKATEDGVSFTKASNGLLTMIVVNIEGGVINQVYVMMADGTGENGILEGESYRELMLYMGESHSFGDQTWPFLALSYKDGGETVTIDDYSVALENVATICDNGDIKLLWAAGSHGAMFTKAYQSSEKANFVAILIK